VKSLVDVVGRRARSTVPGVLRSVESQQLDDRGRHASRRRPERRLAAKPSALEPACPAVAQLGPGLLDLPSAARPDRVRRALAEIVAPAVVRAVAVAPKQGRDHQTALRASSNGSPASTEANSITQAAPSGEVWLLALSVTVWWLTEQLVRPSLASAVAGFDHAPGADGDMLARGRGSRHPTTGRSAQRARLPHLREVRCWP
jgi:hypothetical protein